MYFSTERKLSKALRASPPLSLQLADKLENIPKECLAWQLPGLPFSPTQQSASRTYSHSKKDTMAFSMGEAATTATSGVVRGEEQEQLTFSCSIAIYSIIKGA